MRTDCALTVFLVSFLGRGCPGRGTGVFGEGGGGAVSKGCVSMGVFGGVQTTVKTLPSPL